MTRSPGVWLVIVACVVVGAAIVGGLLVVGGPGEARLERLDAARLDDLYAIERTLVTEWRRTGTLPASLTDLETRLAPDNLVDPETDEPYEYRVRTDSTAELCATFLLASEPSRYPRDSDIGAHGAGRHCFTVRPAPN